jgi:glycosyltransferase involved in cell wall biosynthesis
MPDQDILSVYLSGNFDFYDSYGLIGCQLVRHLSKLGAHVNAIALGKPVMDNQPSDIRALTQLPIQPVGGGIFLGYPTSYHKQSAMAFAGPKIALTMFESSLLPAGWADILNTMDAVIVPSWFCNEVFYNSGVRVPVYVIPLGLSEIYSQRDRTIPKSMEEAHLFATGGHPGYTISGPSPYVPPTHYQRNPELPRPFTFLTFKDRGPRKGGVAAINAFLREFGDDENFHLVIKERSAEINLVPTNKNFTHIRSDFNESKLLNLYMSVDCLVNPNKGEGFGLIPREFAATGGIALTTAWGGTADGINEWGVPLKYKLVKADWKGNKTLEGQEVGEWAHVPEEEIAASMRRVAQQRLLHYRLAHLRAHSAKLLYSWSNFAQQVYSVWKGVADGNRTRVSVAAR